MPTDFARIQNTPLSLDTLLSGSDRADCGALAIFAGTVRNHHEGRAVRSLTYSSYARVAEKLIREIEAEIAARFQVPLCLAVHRVGPLGIGETAILAIARGHHRAETFAAMQALVEAVKHRVPIWKEEFYADGSSAFVNGCTLVAAEDLPPAESRLHCIPTQSADRRVGLGPPGLAPTPSVG
ncbi:MAG: molybdenum cofactor biosynthesis protein MoaE [Pseudomonadota bacterium]